MAASAPVAPAAAAGTSLMGALKMAMDFYFAQKKGTVWEWRPYVPHEIDGGLLGVFQSYDFKTTPAFTAEVQNYRKALINVIPARIRIANANWALVQAIAARSTATLFEEPWSPSVEAAEAKYEHKDCSRNHPSDEDRTTDEGVEQYAPARLEEVVPGDCSRCYYHTVKAHFPQLLTQALAAPHFFHSIYDGEYFEELVLMRGITHESYTLVKNLQLTAEELKFLRDGAGGDVVMVEMESKEQGQTPLVNAIVGLRQALLDSEADIKQLQDAELRMDQVAADHHPMDDEDDDEDE